MRPRLIDKLNQSINSKLTLISAPAGFGKTTLVTEWLQSMGDDVEVAWISLDENDNDPVRFLTYLVEALNRKFETELAVGIDALTMLQLSQQPEFEVVLATLINDLIGIEKVVFLVLDDYHLIDVQAVHEALTYLLENIPSNLHLVIATREDPFLPISRLRVRNQITEIRATDLRFSVSEAATFLNQIMELELSNEEVDILETRTEGWIAGLQLAAISMQGQVDASKSIESFSGSNRLVLDYLIEEVLNLQSEEIEAFLLKTSVLNRLIGPLCDALTELEDGQAILERLDHANLFIIPLDSERQWYRYHHLFADLLNQRLQSVYPELVRDLHARAVVWFEDNDLLPEAIQHAFDGNDMSAAVRLIEKGALRALELSEFGFILNAVDRISPDMLNSSPWLFVYYCWALLHIGRIASVTPKIEDTDWLLSSISSDEHERMRGYIAGLKMSLYAWQRDYDQLDTYFDQVKAFVPENHWIRAYCVMVVGVRNWNLGDLRGALECFRNAVSIGESIENKRVSVTAAGYLGSTLELLGNLHQATKVIEDALASTDNKGSELPVACYLNVDYARLLCEMNEFALAKKYITRGIKQSKLLVDDRMENLAHCFAARIFLASGEIDAAAEFVRKSEKSIPSPDTVYDLRGGEYPHIRLWLKQRKFSDLEFWLEQENLDHDTSVVFKTRMTYTMHARVMISLARANSNEDGYLMQAQDLLLDLLKQASKSGWGAKVIEIQVLQALAYDLADNMESAMAALEGAIHLAEPGGFIRIFVDEGPPMGKLLFEALSRGIAPDYVRKLLAAFPDAESEKAVKNQRIESDTDWIEPLTDRELDVLQLIADGLSRQEIATKLVLSLNTIKTHARNAYSKLGVNSQLQAVTKAKALGLLEKE